MIIVSIVALLTVQSTSQVSHKSKLFERDSLGKYSADEVVHELLIARNLLQDFETGGIKVGPWNSRNLSTIFKGIFQHRQPAIESVNIELTKIMGDGDLLGSVVFTLYISGRLKEDLLRKYKKENLLGINVDFMKSNKIVLFPVKSLKTLEMDFDYIRIRLGSNGHSLKYQWGILKYAQLSDFN